MHISITGFNLPGSTFCRPDGSIMDNVHVGVQLGRDPAHLMKADLHEVEWNIDVDAIERDGDLDFRGPAVQGKRGERFVYLTWGNIGRDGDFEMFRRAKLMLDRADDAVVRSAIAAGHLIARINLTGPNGSPTTARVDPPAIEWSVGSS